MIDYQTVETDILIIGGGGAGARAAIELGINGVKVSLINKGVISRSGLTPMAGYSIQAAFGHEDPRDNSGVHFQDTVREGRGLADQNLVKVLTEEATERVEDLERYGVQFEKKGDKLSQVIHPGQSYPRINRMPQRGYGMMVALKRELKKHRDIKTFEDCIATSLLADDDGVRGATVLDLRNGTFYAFNAKMVIIATGGHQEIWGKTDTEPGSTGDGVALAYDAGADLVDMEMMLYYPVVTVATGEYPSVPQLLQYEALLRQEYLAGKLLNAKGEDFLPRGELPARDIMMQLIVKEIREGRGTEHGGVYIDVSKSPKTNDEIDRLIKEIGCDVQFKRVEYLGIDLRKEPVEISPACHFGLGGIRINENTETTIPGLYAAGEAAGNVHGANRISGNALMETQVFGFRAGKFAAEKAKEFKKLSGVQKGKIDGELSRISSFSKKKRNGVRPILLKKKLKKIMDDYVGLDRNEKVINSAIEKIKEMKEDDLPRVESVDIKSFNYELQEAIEIAFMLNVSVVVAHAALTRRESRGHHLRSDYPQQEDSWLKHTIVRQRDGNLVCSTAPVITLT